MRPLGVQIIALAYRTGEAWNESAYSNPEFDKKLNAALAIADAGKRKELMKDIETILQDSGIIIQPFWRKLYRHHAEHVKGLFMHQTFELQLDKVWLDVLFGNFGRGRRPSPIWLPGGHEMTRRRPLA